MSEVFIDYYGSKTLPEFLFYLQQSDVSEKYYKYCIDRFLDIKAREERRPISGQFELTPLCNLDCKMCYVHISKSQLGDARILSTKEWIRIIDEALEAGMMKATLSGGECLAYPGFDEIYLHLMNSGCDVCVKTNGVLLNAERIAFFEKYPPELLSITLYGSSEDSYERVTGHRMFSRVYNNILAAKAANMPLKISITPNAFMDDLKETIALVHNMELPYVINSFLVDPREETERSTDGIHSSSEEFVEAIAYRNSLNGEEFIPYDERDVPDIRRDDVEVTKGIICGAGRSGFEIDWRGRMFGCTSIEELSTEYSIGNFKEAWEIVNEKAENYQMPIDCIGCNYYNICEKCPAIHAHALKGHADERVCSRTRLLVARGIASLDVE